MNPASRDFGLAPVKRAKSMLSHEGMDWVELVLVSQLATLFPPPLIMQLNHDRRQGWQLGLSSVEKRSGYRRNFPLALLSYTVVPMTSLSGRDRRHRISDFKTPEYTGISRQS
jgi:hypothetical protein